MTRHLSERQRKVCREMLTGCTQKEAFLRCGYAPKSAQSNASRFFARADVKAYLARLRESVEKDSELTAERILAEYAKIALLDPRRFFDADGNFLSISKLPPEAAAAIAGMDVVVERVDNGEGRPQFAEVRKIKFCDKKGALDSAARCLGMMVNKFSVEDEDKPQTVLYLPEKGSL